MLKQTNLKEVKAAAVALLMTDINETSFSPLIVQHPFTSSGFIGLKRNGSFQILNITSDLEGLQLWQRKVREQIEKADNAFKIYMMITKPYGLTFLKYAAPHLSQEDLSHILSSAWIMSENPNADANLSKRQLVSLFRSADPFVLMDEDERQALAELDSPVTVYRGVTSYNKKNVRALSWTLNYETAEWFANRFGENGTVYEAQVDKGHILALFNGRSEAEVIIDPRHIAITDSKPVSR